MTTRTDLSIAEAWVKDNIKSDDYEDDVIFFHIKEQMVGAYLAGFRRARGFYEERCF